MDVERLLQHLPCHLLRHQRCRTDGKLGQGRRQVEIELDPGRCEVACAKSVANRQAVAVEEGAD